LQRHGTRPQPYGECGRRRVRQRHPALDAGEGEPDGEGERDDRHDHWSDTRDGHAAQAVTEETAAMKALLIAMLIVVALGAPLAVLARTSPPPRALPLTRARAAPPAPHGHDTRVRPPAKCDHRQGR